MSIAEFSIKNKVITLLVVVIFFFGGLYYFNNLGRLEDPEFTIKTAKVFTPYPGASPREVEEEVTDKVEDAIQELQYIDEITSKSYPGMSEIEVEIMPKYTKDDLPQIWDELRRKINDVQPDLPPGAEPSFVYDDYGDVFGLYYAITGDGYSYRELKEYAKYLKKEILIIDNVSKVDMGGTQEEQIFIEISQAKLASLKISPNLIIGLLESQNLISPSGNVKVGDSYIRINPTGQYTSEKELGDLLVTELSKDQLIYLKDIATIKRGYQEVPNFLIDFNNKPAVTLAVSLASGGNIIELEKKISDKLNFLKAYTPAGLEIHEIYNQAKYVDQSINGFVVSLIQALVIVIAVLLISMGLTSGLIIGGILLLSIFGTFIFMGIFGINLERISLGALIIALGMLVDNAIVVAEGILVKIKNRENPLESAKTVVNNTIWPLLGATIVGILAFAPIGLSDDSTGEYCSSLFYVIAISLLLSWYLAITATPYFCVTFIKPDKNKDTSSKQNTADKPEKLGLIYSLYKNILLYCIKFRWFTVAIMAILFIISLNGFKYVKQSFFPDSMTPIFMIDYWREQGADIRTTKKDVNEIVDYVLEQPGVEDVVSFTGKGATRFTLTYEPEKANASFSQLLIKVKSYEDIKPLSKKLNQKILDTYSSAETKSKYIRLGPGEDAKIEVRILGDDPVVLRSISEQVKDIMFNTKKAKNIKDDWRQKVQLLVPEYSDVKAKKTGITRPMLKQALLNNFSGRKIGIYREKDELLPIVSRPPDNERLDVSSINSLRIWSPTLSDSVPIEQVVDGFSTDTEDQLIYRQDRKRVITASCDPDNFNTNKLFSMIRTQVEGLNLPPGYFIEWGGEYESSTDAQAALFKQIPKGLFFMIVIVILLFSALKQPAIIFLTLPLAMIGVTLGLLLTGKEFGFMPLLGLLSLSGMLIKNAIVLIDQIDLEIKQGKDPFDAVVDSAISRVRPVSLAAATTVLGMIPLLPDVFFSSMAVLIMFGLSFATILTLLFVPVLYTIFFNIKYKN